MSRAGPAWGTLVALAAGVGALLLGTAMGWDRSLLEAVVTPPPLLRAVLVALSTLFALGALGSGIRRISDGRDPDAGGPAALVRGVRLVFLAVAGVSAASGWLLGHPLPLIVALVIAAVDVIETTFLLLVLGTGRLGRRD